MVGEAGAPAATLEPVVARPTLAARLARSYGLAAAREYGGVAWLLAAGTVASYLGRGAAVPFVAIYLVGTVGIPLAVLGAGVFVEQAVRAVASPLFGGLSDRLGRKPFMVGGVVLQASVFPAYLLVHDLPTYLAISVLAGLGQAPYQPALSAFVGDVTPAHQRVGVFGLIHMTKNLGWSLGILLGALLVTRSFVLLFVVAGLLPLVYAAFLAFAIREPTRVVAPGEADRGFPALRHLARGGVFTAFLGLALLLFVTWGPLDTVLPVFVQAGLAFDPSWISYAFAVNSVLIVALQVPVATRVEQWPRARGLAVAMSITAVAYLVLATAPSLAAQHWTWGAAALLLGVVVLTVAEMIDAPLTFTLAAELAPSGARGGAMGVLALAAPLGLGAAPFLAGVITPVHPWGWVWLVYAALALVGVGGFLLLSRHLPSTRTPAGGS